MPSTTTAHIEMIARDLAQEGNYTRANSLFALVEERDALRAAVRTLTNEVRGNFTWRDSAIREAIGNTNYACVMDAVWAALALLEPSAPKPRADETAHQTEGK